MSTIYTPTVTETKQTKTIVVEPVKTADFPERGTLMRATLGNTSIEFRMAGQSGNADMQHRLFYGNVEGVGHSGFREITFWLDIPWTFEILDEPVIEVEVEAEARELVSA